MEENDTAIAKIFKAISDENRIYILRMLQSGERCSCEILEDMNISQSTLSHHIKILSDVNLITGRKDGKWTHYSLHNDTTSIAFHYLKDLTCTIAQKSVDCSCLK